MIVAVEGPSAAGKTTWCRQHASVFVAEHAPTGLEADPSGASDQAAFRVGVNSARWRAALDLESRSRTALCDSDPLKLHYSWCLARMGAAPWSCFADELAHTRLGFESEDPAWRPGPDATRIAGATISEQLHPGVLSTFLDAGFVEVLRTSARRAVVAIHL